MRRILLATVAASLALAGCGGSDGGSSGDLDAVTISKADSPKVSVPEDFAVDETSTKVVTEGDGDEIYDGDTITANYVAVNGRTGKQFDTSFATDAPPALTLTSSMTMGGIIKGLTGQKVGSRLLVAISPEDGFGQAQSQYDIEADDTMVFMFDIIGKYPEGEATALPKSLPSLVLDDKEHPTGFASSKDVAKKQTKESVHVVNQGTGATVQANQNLMANYVGQIYGTDTVFDESWTDGPQRPFQIGVGAVIKCWDDLLVGQKLGSRVVVVCPADVAYGDNPPEGSPIKAGDTLMFVVDLLATY